MHYPPDRLIGRQVLAVVNFPPRQIGPFLSEVLVLGVPDENGAVVLLRPDLKVPDGGQDVLSHGQPATTPSAGTSCTATARRWPGG